jgi:hypothetical protein
MSVQHAVSRSVRDSAALLDAVAGPALGDPYDAPPPARPYLAEVGANPGRLRIALQTTAFNGAEVDRDCLAAARDAAELCRSLGHEVEEAELALDRELVSGATGVIISANLRATLLERGEQLGRAYTADDLEPLAYLMAEGAKAREAADYARAIRAIHRIGRQVSTFLARYDALLTPTMATPPLPLGRLALTRTDFAGLVGDLARTIGFTQLFNASGHPAMSVPLSWNAAGCRSASSSRDASATRRRCSGSPGSSRARGRGSRGVRRSPSVRRPQDQHRDLRRHAEAHGRDARAEARAHEQVATVLDNVADRIALAVAGGHDLGARSTAGIPARRACVPRS